MEMEPNKLDKLASKLAAKHVKVMRPIIKRPKHEDKLAHRDVQGEPYEVDVHAICGDQVLKTDQRSFLRAITDHDLLHNVPRQRHLDLRQWNIG